MSETRMNEVSPFPASPFTASPVPASPVPGSGALLQQEFGDFAKLVHLHARERPEATAFIQGDRRWSYAQLDGVMDQVAAALQRDGIREGEAIAICAATSIEYAAVFLGALRARV